MARDIRDNERNGRGEVHTIDEGKEPEAVTKVSFNDFLLV